MNEEEYRINLNQLNVRKDLFRELFKGNSQTKSTLIAQSMPYPNLIL